MSIKLGNSNITLKVGSSAVTAAYLGSTQVYPQGETHDYSTDYFTFRVKSASSFSFGAQEEASANTLSYSLDNGSTWNTLQNGSSTQTFQTGTKIMWKGSNLVISEYDEGIGSFSSTGDFVVEGNIMSLIYGDNFSGQTTLQNTDQFSRLFKNCSHLTNAENLILPATTLTKQCYYKMFDGCSSLTAAPDLPATTLTNYCYFQMFNGCTSLTAAPELHATTLADDCYQDMFNGCTSLTTAPELPATTLFFYCYCNMFYGCTSLTTAPILSATTLAIGCYATMFSGCANLNKITCLAIDISAYNCTGNWVSGVAASGTFVKSASMTSWATDANGIPSGWNVQDYI